MAPKEFPAVWSAELVYGSAITLPGQFQSEHSRLVVEEEVALPSVPSPPPIWTLSYAQVAASVPQAVQCASHMYEERL